MQILPIINYFLVVALVSILFLGSILIIRHQYKSVYRRFLLTMLFFWGVIMLGIIYRFVSDGFSLFLNFGVANIQILLLGLPCFFTLISYPAAVLNADLIKFKNWLILLSPMTLFLTIYFVWHYASGVDPFTEYSFTEFWQNINTPTVIMRLAIIVLFYTYVIMIQMVLWQLVPIYNRYVNENASDNSYNVDWVRTLIKYIAIVCMTYLSIVFSESLIFNTIYLVSLIALFSFIVDRSLFYRPLDAFAPLRVKWSKETGWYVCELDGRDPNIVLSGGFVNQVELVGEYIDRWMNVTLKYTKIDFMTDDILVDFPNLTHDELTNVFKSKGETFQSYVRRFRIKRACEIIDSNSDNIYPKQLFSMVGFSHYSSFSRAFLAVMGQSPTEYINNAKRSKHTSKRV